MPESYRTHAVLSVMSSELVGFKTTGGTTNECLWGLADETKLSGCLVVVVLLLSHRTDIPLLSLCWYVSWGRRPFMRSACSRAAFYPLTPTTRRLVARSPGQKPMRLDSHPSSSLTIESLTVFGTGLKNNNKSNKPVSGAKGGKRGRRRGSGSRSCPIGHMDLLVFQMI